MSGRFTFHTQRLSKLNERNIFDAFETRTELFSATKSSADCHLSELGLNLIQQVLCRLRQDKKRSDKETFRKSFCIRGMWLDGVMVWGNWFKSEESALHKKSESYDCRLFAVPCNLFAGIGVECIPEIAGKYFNASVDSIRLKTLIGRRLKFYWMDCNLLIRWMLVWIHDSCP